MGYKPPGYRDLHTNTNMLHDYFNKLINRYIPPSYEQMRQKISSLETKYNSKIRKKSGLLVSTTPELRRDQVACIYQLLSKLQLEGEVPKINNMQRILLGAVIYRYLRIKKSYGDGWGLYSMFGYTPDDNCTIYQILEEDFEFKKRKLDDATIATCCEAYKAYLEQELVSATGEKQKVGDQFPYIQDDKGFYKKLGKIINEARENAREVIAQLQIISFVQSAAASLREMDNTALDVLPKFTTLVSTKLTKKLDKRLTSEELTELLNSMHPALNETTKEILKLGLPQSVSAQGVFTKVIIPNSSPIRTEEKYISFQQYVEEALIMNGQYAVLGAYVLALSCCKTKARELKDALNHAIAAQGFNQLDVDTKRWGLTAFHNYVTIPGISPINYKCWHPDTGYEHMDRELEQQLNRLSHVQEEEEVVPTIF